VKVPGPPPLRLRRRRLRRHGGEGRAAGALRDHRRIGLHRGRSDGGFRVVTRPGYVNIAIENGQL